MRREYKYMWIKIIVGGGFSECEEKRGAVIMSLMFISVTAVSRAFLWLAYGAVGPWSHEAVGPWSDPRHVSLSSSEWPREECSRPSAPLRPSHAAFRWVSLATLALNWYLIECQGMLRHRNIRTPTKFIPRNFKSFLNIRPAYFDKNQSIPTKKYVHIIMESGLKKKYFI